MSWYGGGFGNETPAEQQRKTGDKVFRFWMKPGSDTQITVVDSAVLNLIPPGETQAAKVPAPFIYFEYNLNINGSWKNWFTKPLVVVNGKVSPTELHEDDLLGRAGQRASECAVLTVIDHTQWKDRNGNLHKDELKLYVMKTASDTYAAMMKLAGKFDGNLRGLKLDVSRPNDPKSPSVGSVLQPADFAQPKVSLADDVQPFNYLVELAPPSAEDLRSKVPLLVQDDEDIPF